MKKLFLIFMMFSIFFLIGCEKNTENKKELIENTSREKSEVIYNSTECKSDMKLWINKTYNFSICIPKTYLGYDAYGHSLVFNDKLKAFITTDNNGKLYILNDDISIGESGNNNKIYFGLCSVLENQNNKNIYSFKTKKGKNICFSFDKQTEEIKNILESIKVLNEFKKNENKGKDSIKELKYKRIIDYSKMDIKDITKEFLKNDIEDEYILVDLQFEKSHKKLEKILNIINILSKEGKIDSFELHCKNLNFNKNELKILENVNIKKLFLEDMCGFKKDKFTQTWYDKQKVIKFLKQAKYIKEIEIGYIDTDLFLKENGEIKVYR